jgi:hypothetical protein
VDFGTHGLLFHKCFPAGGSDFKLAGRGLILPLSPGLSILAVSLLVFCPG